MGNDTISSLSVNGNASQSTSILATGSWDGIVRAYQVQMKDAQSISSINKVLELNPGGGAPVFATDITPDSSHIISAGCDQMVKLWNLQTGQATDIGRHTAPIKAAKCITWGSGQHVVSAGWDKMIHIWDARSPTPAMSQQLSERIYAMDCNDIAIAAVTADRKVHTFNLTQGCTKIAESQAASNSKDPTKYQVKSVAMMADGKGFAYGSIEGRVTLEYFDELGFSSDKKKKGFTFKCHRSKVQMGNGAQQVQTMIYSVNALAFHPLNALATGGSDGNIYTWDYQNKGQLSSFEEFKTTDNTANNAVNAIKFTPDGHFMYYTMANDWSMGQPAGQVVPPRIMVKRLKPDNVTPGAKPKQSGNRSHSGHRR